MKDLDGKKNTHTESLVFFTKIKHSSKGLVSDSQHANAFINMLIPLKYS